MGNKSELSELAIAQKLKEKKPFIVGTERERKRALTASKFLGISIVTRSVDKGGFQINFLSE
jgi:hypothetical protein